MPQIYLYAENNLAVTAKRRIILAPASATGFGSQAPEKWTSQFTKPFLAWTPSGLHFLYIFYVYDFLRQIKSSFINLSEIESQQISLNEKLIIMAHFAQYKKALYGPNPPLPHNC